MTNHDAVRVMLRVFELERLLREAHEKYTNTRCKPAIKIPIGNDGTLDTLLIGSQPKIYRTKYSILVARPIRSMNLARYSHHLIDDNANAPTYPRSIFSTRIMRGQ